MFSCEVCEIFNNTYFEEHMRKAASTCPKITFYQARGSFQLAGELCKTLYSIKLLKELGVMHEIVLEGKSDYRDK